MRAFYTSRRLWIKAEMGLTNVELWTSMDFICAAAAAPWSLTRARAETVSERPRARAPPSCCSTVLNLETEGRNGRKKLLFGVVGRVAYNQQGPSLPYCVMSGDSWSRLRESLATIDHLLSHALRPLLTSSLCCCARALNTAVIIITIDHTTAGIGRRRPGLSAFMLWPSVAVVAVTALEAQGGCPFEGRFGFCGIDHKPQDTRLSLLYR